MMNTRTRREAWNVSPAAAPKAHPGAAVRRAPSRWREAPLKRGADRCAEWLRLGDLEEVSAMLKLGLLPDSRDQYGQSLLYLAVLQGERAVRLFLESGAAPNIRDHAGRTPLHVAARRSALGDARAVSAALLRAGADVNALTRAGLTPLDETRPTCACGAAHSRENAGYQAFLVQNGGHFGAQAGALSP